MRYQRKNRTVLSIILVMTLIISSISTYRSNEVYAVENDTDIWSGELAEEFTGGAGTEEDPYLIATGEQLAYFSYLVNSGEKEISGKLVSDIYLNDVEKLKAGQENYEEIHQWIPIGNRENKFTGSFNGNEHSISGMYINSTQNSIGLFGWVDTGTIANIDLKDGAIIVKDSSSSDVGAIVGYQTGGMISDSHSTNIEIVVEKSSQYVSIGGIAGVINYGASINNCYSNSNITVINTTVEASVGGIVGLIGGNRGLIQKCYNLGNIYSGTSAGGIAGSIYGGTINDCYNMGNIEGKNCAGGISGKDGNSNYINRSYNMGKVEGEGEIGGIAPDGNYKIIVENGYYLEGRKSEDGTPLSLSDFAKVDSFVGFDFDEVWEMSEARPLLKNNKQPYISEFSFEQSKVIMAKNSSYSIKPIIYPENGITNFEYNSSNSNIVSVLEDGTAVANSLGEAIIRVVDKYTSTSKVFSIKVIPGIESIQMFGKNVMEADSVQKLDIEIAPLEANQNKISWSSSDENIATVDQNGNVTAVLGGDVIITVQSEDGTNIKKEFPIHINRHPEEIELNYEEYSLYVDETVQLKVNIYPEDTTNKDVIWKSYNESVVSVNEEGQVKAVGVGEAKIEVTTVDGGLKKSCIINVHLPVEGIKLNYEEFTLKGIGQEVQLEAIIMPENAFNKNVIWESTNPTVAMVDETGRVRAVGEGETIVVAVTENGGFMAMCTITVKDEIINIHMSDTEVMLDINAVYQLTVLNDLNNKIDNQLIKWSSNNNNVVTVDENGSIRAISSGSAEVIATVGSVTTKCKIIVSDKSQYTLALFSTPYGAGKLVGGGVYTEGNSITITAEPVSGYHFNGWYYEETLVSTNPKYTFTLEKDMKLTAKFTANLEEKLTVLLGNGTVQYTVNEITKKWYNDVTNIKFPKGTEITVKAIPNTNATFLYWIDMNTGRIVSRDQMYSFALGSSTQLKACYRNKSDMHYVIFVDRNDNVLSTQEVEDGQAAIEPEHGFFNGYEFVGWDSTFSNVTNHMTITAIYQPKAGYQLIVENGTIENPKDNYFFMEKVKVTADEPQSGMYFAGWYEDDILISTNKEHYIFITNSTTLIAKYSDTPIVDEAWIYMKMAERVPAEENKEILTMKVNWHVPSGYSVVEGGLLRTLDEDASSELSLENVDDVIIVANRSSLVVANGTYDYTLKFGVSSKLKTLYARGYLTYKNNSTGEMTTIYSDLMTSPGSGN